MSSNAINAKSKKIQARTPHDVIDEMEKVKAKDESTGQFIVTAIRSEIKRRRHRKSKKQIGL